MNSPAYSFARILESLDRAGKWNYRSLRRSAGTVQATFTFIGYD